MIQKEKIIPREPSGKGKSTNIAKMASESIEKTAISLDRKALENAKVAFIYRENEFLNLIASKIKERRSNDFCAVTIESGTESLSSDDLKKMQDVFKLTKESRILTLTDRTAHNLCDSIPYDERKHSLDFLYSNGLFSSKGLRWVKRMVGLGSDEKMVDAEIMKNDSRELRAVLGHLAKRVKQYGAENIVILVGYESSENALGRTLSEHGIVIEKNGKDVEFRSYLCDIQMIKDIYEFVENTLKGFNLKVYPSIGIYPQRFNAIDLQIDKAKSAILFDRHAFQEGGNTLGEGYCAVFVKHEYNLIQDKKIGDYLPFVDEQDKGSVDLVIESVDAAIQQKLEGMKTEKP